MTGTDALTSSRHVAVRSPRDADRRVALHFADGGVTIAGPIVTPHRFGTRAGDGRGAKVDPRAFARSDGARSAGSLADLPRRLVGASVLGTARAAGRPTAGA